MGVTVYRFEAELRDSSEHDSWQREAVAADLAARAEAVRRRRDDMAAAQEAAIHARLQLVQENQQAGHRLKVAALPTLIHCLSLHVVYSLPKSLTLHLRA